MGHFHLIKEDLTRQQDRLKDSNCIGITCDFPGPASHIQTPGVRANRPVLQAVKLSWVKQKKLSFLCLILSNSLWCADTQTKKKKKPLVYPDELLQVSLSGEERKMVLCDIVSPLEINRSPT